MTDEELKSLVASLAEESKETERQFQQLKEMFAETDRKMEKTDLKIAKLSEQIGGIDNNIGYHAEQFFQNVFADNKVFGGIKYNDMILNMKHKGEDEGVEFDIVLKNGSSMALIEVKSRIHPAFVKKFAKERISKFRKYFQEYKNYNVYLGIAGFSFSEAVLKEAKKYGVGIIRQVGNGIEVEAIGLRAYH